MKSLIGLILIAIGGLIAIICAEPVIISAIVGLALMAIGVLLVISEDIGERTISFEIEDIKNTLIREVNLDLSYEEKGVQELVEAMKFTKDVLLLIVGSGDVLPVLKKKVEAGSLGNKVMFFPKMPFAELVQFTLNADGGLTLDKDSNLNYRYSLPNKIFDYIHCGIPVIASKLPEIDRIFGSYPVGLQIPSHDPKDIAATIHDFFSDAGRYHSWKEQVKKAALEYSWVKEEKKMNDLIDDIG